MKMNIARFRDKRQFGGGSLLGDRVFSNSRAKTPPGAEGPQTELIHRPFVDLLIDPEEDIAIALQLLEVIERRR